MPLEGVYSSSVVFAGDDAVKAEPVALFCAEDSNSCHLEVYPRVDGSVYMCGIGGSDYVRGDRLREGGDLQDATKMRANPDRVAAAVASFGGLAPSSNRAERSLSAGEFPHEQSLKLFSRGERPGKISGDRCGLDGGHRPFQNVKRDLGGE